MSRTAREIIFGYIQAAEKGVALLNKDKTPKLDVRTGKPRIVYSCHTVYFKPEVTVTDEQGIGHSLKMKSLNDTLREAGYDPIEESQKLIQEGVIFGKPVTGGFSLAFAKTLEKKVKASTIKNMALLEKLLG